MKCRKSRKAYLSNRYSALLVALLLLPVLAFPAAGSIRDPAQRAAFKRAHPCPTTGRARGACPGYVVDQIRPLCAGGLDHPANMQWQTRADAKAKDRAEVSECRGLRGK
jgi:hypothetical protein